MKVYLTGLLKPEALYKIKLFVNYEDAYERWDNLRRQLIQEANHYVEEGKEMMRIGKKMLNSLDEDNPSKIDNYPWDTPVIFEKELIGSKEDIND